MQRFFEGVRGREVPPAGELRDRPLDRPTHVEHHVVEAGRVRIEV